MAIPAILYATSATQVLPVVASFAVWGRRPPAPYPLLLTWCAVLVASDGLDLLVAFMRGPNLWLAYFTLPVELCLTLLLLAEWQLTARLRSAYRRALPVCIAGHAVFLALTDRAVTFEIWVIPLSGLIALAGILHTLVHRSLTSRGPLTDQGWFWVLLGMALFWATFVPVPPFAQAFIAPRIDWVRSAYIVRSWIKIAAFALITWGVVCQRLATRSPGHS